MTTTSPALATADERATRLGAVARAARPQVLVLTGQLAAGIGNLLFAVVAARIFSARPEAYSNLTAFIALQMMLSLPAAALAAAGALAPERVVGLRRGLAGFGIAVGAVLVLGAEPLGEFAGLPTAMMVALGAAAPAAALTGLERGIAYGSDQPRLVARNLITEALVRFSLGLALAAAFGPIGAAFGVVVSVYAGLATYYRFQTGDDDRLVATPLLAPWADPAGPRAEDESDRPTIAKNAAVATGATFVLLSVLQSQDLLVANRLLDATDAARFSVLSTLGGAAAFATATIPMVLLPAAARRRPHAATVAIGLTAGVGGGIALAGAFWASTVVGRSYGPAYADIAGFLGPYLLAMALLGVARVLVARRCATGGTTYALVSVGAAVGLGLLTLVTLADTVGATVVTTFAATAGLAGVLAFPDVARLPTVQRGRARITAGWRSPASLGLFAACAVAAVVRLAASRGLWIDEATSVFQAKLPFGAMMDNLRQTDVHPPFHYIVLWVWTRVFGTSEFAVRLPSLLAGVALVPVMHATARLMYDRRTAWVVTWLTAIAPFCVWYSQEARMYSQFMLFAALAVYGQLRVLRSGHAVDWLIYGAATAAMLWTQYFGLLPFAVQQAGFAAAYWNRRNSATSKRALLRGWLLTTVLLLVLLVPVVAVLRDQFAAYANRSSALGSMLPGQAGGAVSTVNDDLSIYSIGANMIWAVWGYHSDNAMTSITALWPLLMLAALVMLGRGRSRSSLLLLGLVAVPIICLLVVGSRKRDLFELRYAAGVVPAALLLCARFITATTRRRAAVVTATGLAVVSLGIGLVDQQINGANPRFYGFEEALDKIKDESSPGDVLVYEPVLRLVVDYYAPDIESRETSQMGNLDGRRVWILTTDRLGDSSQRATAKGSRIIARLGDRQIISEFEGSNVHVWELG